MPELFRLLSEEEAFLPDPSQPPFEPSAATGLRHRVPSPLRVVTRFEPPEGPKLVIRTTPQNAARQEKVLDEVYQRHPNPLESESAWLNMVADAFGDRDIPIPPHQAIKNINDPELIAERLNRLTPEQVDMARHGLQLAENFGRLYGSGRATPVDTTKLFLWSILSRWTTVANQEAAFLDAVRTIGPWIEMALRGEFDEAARDAYLK